MRSAKPIVALWAIPLLALVGCPDEPGGLCELNGQRLSLGQRVDKGDGCNECTCLSTGQMDCTERTCDGPGGDGGPGGGDDGGPRPGSDGGEGDAGQTDGGDVRPPSDCVDNDEDGFHTCLDPNYPEWPQEVDCDDTRWFVQPGGYEFPGNNIDDNCNDEVDETPTCSCVADGNSVPGADFIAAMDLCDDTVASVSTSGDAQQFGVYSRFFEDISPQEGGCLGVLSTGIVGETDLELNGANLCGCGAFDGCSPDPDPETPGDDVCDLAQLRLTLNPPPNAKGIEFNFMFLTVEWPEFLCTSFNDTFYTLYTSQAVNGGQQANISFDAEQRQITVNVGFFEAPRDWTVPLDNTPFGATDASASCTSLPVEGCFLPGYCNDPNYDLDRVGSGSGWLVTRAPFEPGEESIDVVFSIHDEGDGIYDSAVILDSLRWVPYRPRVQTTKD